MTITVSELLAKATERDDASVMSTDEFSNGNDDRESVTVMTEDDVRIYMDNWAEVNNTEVENIIVETTAARIDPTHIDSYDQFAGELTESTRLVPDDAENIQTSLEIEGDLDLDEVLTQQQEAETLVEISIEATRNSTEIQSPAEVFGIAHEVATTANNVYRKYVSMDAVPINVEN